MNIDDLTLGQIKQLRTLFAGEQNPQPAPASGRAVVVIDRGWIIAGDRSITPDGKLRLDRAVHVFRWESIGFAKMLEEWRSSKVDLRPLMSVEIPLDCEIFSVPVESDWGIK